MRAAAELELQSRLLEAAKQEVTRREAVLAAREATLADQERSARAASDGARQRVAAESGALADSEARLRAAQQELQQVGGRQAHAVAGSMPMQLLHLLPGSPLPYPCMHTHPCSAWRRRAPRRGSSRLSARRSRRGSAAWRRSSGSWSSSRPRRQTRCRTRAMPQPPPWRSATRCALGGRGRGFGLLRVRCASYLGSEAIMHKPSAAHRLQSLHAHRRALTWPRRSSSWLCCMQSSTARASEQPPRRRRPRLGGTASRASVPRSRSAAAAPPRCCASWRRARRCWHRWVGCVFGGLGGGLGPHAGLQDAAALPAVLIVQQ